MRGASASVRKEGGGEAFAVLTQSAERWRAKHCRGGRQSPTEDGGEAGAGGRGVGWTDRGGSGSGRRRTAGLGSQGLERWGGRSCCPGRDFGDGLYRK